MNCKKILYILLFALIATSVFAFSSCGGNSVKDRLFDDRVWETESDAEGNSIRWTFTATSVTTCSVIYGEDTFSQTFLFDVENNNKLVFNSDYATLTFDVEIDGDVMTVVSESNETLIFHKK